MEADSLEEKTMHTSRLYETDFYGWTQEQVTLLKAQQWERLDALNLIEEDSRDSVGRTGFSRKMSLHSRATHEP
jgi:hypothetical protein